MHAVVNTSARAANVARVKCVYVEADMNGLVHFADIIDHLLHIVMLDVVLLNGLTLKVINVTNAHVHKVAEVKFAQIHPGCPVLLLQTRSNAQWHAVGVTTHGRVVSVDIRVRIDPDHL